MHWSDSVLEWMVPALILAAIVWLVLTVLGMMRRRALNITTAETVGDSGAQPGFLSIDREKRDAAMKGGEAFDAHVAQRDAPPPDPSQAKARGFAGKCTVLLAILSLLTGAIGALMRVEAYDNAVKKYGIWDNVVETVSNHTVGFVIAMLVIAVATFNVVRAIQRGTV